ncbi:MAG: hypothetical protein ACRCR9_02380 [Chitinophagaceae bacterium]
MKKILFLAATVVFLGTTFAQQEQPAQCSKEKKECCKAKPQKECCKAKPQKECCKKTAKKTDCKK